MDNSEIESNGSFSLDSIQSDVSSLLSLSSYGIEFAELKHLVSAPEHSGLVSSPSSTHRDLLSTEYEQTIKILKSNSKESQKSNANYIQKLVKTNRQLEEELENANRQIERLISNYRSKQDFKAFQGKLDLENQSYQLNLHCSKLEKQCAVIQQEREKLNTENVHLKISLEECRLERDIKQKSINCLKEKISELHIANQNIINDASKLKFTQNVLNTRLLDLYKSRIWYKKQLSACQDAKSKLHDIGVNYRSEINSYIEHISGLKIQLNKCKNDNEQAKIQASRQQLVISEKLEHNLHFNVTNTEDVIANATHSVVAKSNFNNSHQEHIYRHTIEELKEEIVQIKAANLDKDEVIDKIKSEKSALMDQYISLETILKQRDLDIKLLLCSKKDILSQLELLRIKNANNFSENQQLKRRLLNLEVKLQNRNKEKESVENSVQLIRDQFMRLKKMYEQVKHELEQKNTDLVKPREDNQRVMDNWTASKLDKNILEMLIASLRTENESYLMSIENLKDQLKGIELENATNLPIMTKDEMLRDAIRQLSKKESILYEASNIISEIEPKKPHEKQNSAMTQKDICVPEVTKLTMASENYLETITDDQKVEILFKSQPIPNYVNTHSLLPLNSIASYIRNYMEHLNIDGQERSAHTQLKCLEEQISRYRRRLDREAKSNESQRATIKELEILLQVKDRAMQEKQKKMDRNNRILLRKIKEHMRGRNAAEKQFKHFQELYTKLTQEYNSSQIILNSKDSKINKLEEVSAYYKIDVEKQRSSILILQNQINKIQSCGKCIEFEENQKCLEAELSQMKEDVELLQCKRNALELQFSEQQKQMSTLSTENKAYKTLLINQEEIKMKNVQQEELIEKLQSQLLKTDKYDDRIKQMNEDLVEAANRNQTLSSELEIHSSNFHRSVEYSQELKQKIVSLEEQLRQENTNFQKHMTNCNSKIQGLHTIIQVLKNDRLFFQRISSDLKLALNSCTERNKKLEEQLKQLSSDHLFFKSRSVLLNADLPLGNCNEIYINELLQNFSASLGNKVVVVEMQQYLDGLRDEILNLQKQIFRKNSDTH